MSKKQFIYLFKRELKAARRTRGIMMMVFLMPVLLWGFQLVLPLMRTGLVSGAETTHVDSQSFNEKEKSLQDTTPMEVSADLGIPTMIAIILTFITAIPYVSSSIAGEREKKTMESLLSLPISRRQILFAKFAAGSVLGSISVLINLLGMLAYMYVMSNIIAPANEWSSAAFKIDFNLNLILAMALTLFLCTLLNLGIGISLASLSKDAETSRQLFSLLLMPVILFLSINLFTGLPEMLSASTGSPLPLLLYLVPWMHALAIFQKMMLPTYFTTNDLLLNPLGNVWIDVLFHLVVIFVVLALVIWAASKVFEREGLVS